MQRAATWQRAAHCSVDIATQFQAVANTTTSWPLGNSHLAAATCNRSNDALCVAQWQLLTRS
eukprot:12150009-Alexandrium_andersonii.AAC.1